MAMEFLDLIEKVRAEEASESRLFLAEGRGVRARRGTIANYQTKLLEATRLLEQTAKGSRRAWVTLQEAMTTSDFPQIMGDVLDRILLASYREYPAVYRNFVKVRTVRDFRLVKRFKIDGADGQLEKVPEQAPYPGSSLSEDYYSYQVAKYGRRLPFSWEAMINDDLDALKDIPTRFGRAARRSEQRFATELYVDASGPHASLYTSGNANQVITTNGAASNNPALSVSGLQSAMIVLAKQLSGGEPILIESVELVVPPALEITAMNVVNALQIELTEVGGTSGQKLIAANWMKNRVRVNVDPYIPIVASSANGSTSWFLFANPDAERPALEMGFLAGHEAPEIFIKEPNARRVGGGAVNPMDGDFDTDSIEYKIRHVFGGTREDPKMTVASNGSGS